uniref:aldehyde dehydrogenase (NAD(+)) n=1 Tax=Schlesneria paludicola TaxID=360056 RepID=A0A7C2JZW7_9PLAN
MTIDIPALFQRLGLTDPHSGVCAGDWTANPGGPELVSYNPATGEPLGRVRTASETDYDRVVTAAQAAFERWRRVPAPVRGDYVRRLALALREAKDDLGLLVTLEAGKITSEGRGEVQEMIDIADFAVGLSRQLYGLTMPSERPEHRLFEQWHPLGPVGVLTAFNFPVAVWAWNAMLAAVCGDAIVWKPSPLTPLTAVAVQNLCQRVMSGSGFEAVFSLCLGAGHELGETMACDHRLPLISATGSTRMGRHVGQLVAARLGRSLLELGGNNAVIVTETADLSLALRAVVFAGAGTAGQRCTTLRRLIVHESVAERFAQSVVHAYRSLRVGDPWEEGVLVGPLIRPAAVDAMLKALDAARSQGGEVLCGGARLDRPGWFVTPAVVRAHPGMPIVRTETFAPLLYVLSYRDFDEAIAIQNDSEHGLSSAVFTDRVSEAERFLSPWGSDCGIANVNIGTSGAEIGGAFGGEKGTGGGREAGSDSWKAYMRRQTCTVNYGHALPLAQGVQFDVPG